MTNELTALKRFYAYEHALVVSEMLREDGIETEIRDSRTPVDFTMVDGGPPVAYDVLLPAKDLTRAQKILEKQAEVLVVGDNQDHYLHKFSNPELVEILTKPHEWSEFDVALAKKILADRGEEVDMEEISRRKKEGLRELAKPEKLSTAWILIGYLLSMVGGLLGMICGLLFWTMKKRMPNGKKVFAYDKNSRTHGMLMFFLSLVSMAALFYYAEYG